MNIYIAYMQWIGIYGTENKNSWRHLKCILDKKIVWWKHNNIRYCFSDNSMIPTNQLRYRVGIVTNMIEENCELPIYKVPYGLYAIFDYLIMKMKYMSFGITLLNWPKTCQ